MADELLEAVRRLPAVVARAQARRRWTPERLAEHNARVVQVNRQLGESIAAHDQAVAYGAPPCVLLAGPEACRRYTARAALYEAMGANVRPEEIARAVLG